MCGANILEVASEAIDLILGRTTCCYKGHVSLHPLLDMPGAGWYCRAATMMHSASRLGRDLAGHGWNFW